MYSRRIAYRFYYSDLYIKVKFAVETLIYSFNLTAAISSLGILMGLWPLK